MKPEFQSQTGIILKKLSYGEADEIITVLLKDEGIRRFFVAGSRKSKKRYQGLIDHFSHLNFHYRPNHKGLWRIQDVDIVPGNGHAVWKSMENFSFGNYMAELICEFTPEAVNDHQLYDLWIEMSEKLTTDNCLPPFAKATAGKLTTYSNYLIKIFQTTGYALELNRCVICGKNHLPKTVIFDHVRGGLICMDCAPSTQGSGRIRLSLDIFRESDSVPKEQWQQLLKQLTEFSQNIMQKKSKAAGFFLSTLEVMLQ